MSGHATPHGNAPGAGPRSGPTRRESAWAAGGTLFAGVLLLVVGVIGILQGVAAVAKDNVYSSVGHYAFEFNLASWGWVHIVLGALLVLVGWSVLTARTWARFVGVVLAGLVVIANFMWLPYTPFWALLNIAVAVFVIWALCTDHRRTSV